MRDLSRARERYAAMVDATGFVSGEPVGITDMLRPFVLHANVDLEQLDALVEIACRSTVRRIDEGMEIETAVRGMVAGAIAMGFFLGTEPDE